MSTIFISFASQDRKIAMTLCEVLESRGFQCWISARDIQPGENFQVAIVQAIRHAKAMMLVFTENSNNSQEMTKELALASQQKLMVVPLRIEDVTPNDAFAYGFATRQWIDFFADWEFAIDQLCRRLTAAIGAAPVAAPATAAVVEHAPAPAAKVAPPPKPVPAPRPVVVSKPTVAAAPETETPARSNRARMLALAAVLLVAILVGVGLVAPRLGAQKPAASEPLEASAPLPPPAQEKPAEFLAAALVPIPAEAAETPKEAPIALASTETSALKAPAAAKPPPAPVRREVSRAPVRHAESKLPY